MDGYAATPAGELLTTTITIWPNGCPDAFGLTMICVPGHLTRADAYDLARRTYPRAQLWSVLHHPKGTADA